MGTPSLRAFGRHALGFGVVTTVLVGLLLTLFLWLGVQSPASLARNIPWAFLLTATISAAALLLISIVARLVAKWHPALQWAAYLVTFASAGAIGTLAAPMVLYALGLITRDGISVIFDNHIRGTIPGTIAIGTFFMTIEVWKARVHKTELALRTQAIERERAERLASEAQLASLSARVQPHFLFNTLNTIASLVRDNPRQAEQMVEQLSAVLRSSLDTAVTVPFEREVNLVDDYLQIQRARMGERLRFDVDWDAAALKNARVLPFALQTLVENAIRHVGGQRPEGVAIHLRAHRSGDHVLVEVTDDGPGFDASALSAGHGLDNLEGRLRAVYGARAGLEFERGKGTMTVRVHMPCEP